MKLQSLAVIFVIIILPIVMVLTAYMDNLKRVIAREELYDRTLMDATYDAVRSYQMNTLNNSFASVNTSKERDVKASLNSFFNSLSSGLGKTGVGKNELNTSIPAILFTLYDGYYIYGPYQNNTTISDGKINFSTDNSGLRTEYGLKPYNYYSCNYKKDGEYDLTVNYTLDNYISVMGTYNNEYITASGYYINTNGITCNDSDKTVTINRNGQEVTIEPEILGEYIAVYDTYQEPNSLQIKTTEVHETRYYRYINYNRVKYYFDDSNYNYQGNPNTTWDSIPIFYLENNLRIYLTNNLNTNGSLAKQIQDYIGSSNLSDKNQFKDTNAYHYYKDALEFTNNVKGKLSNIDVNPQNTKISFPYTNTYHTTSTNNLKKDEKSKTHTKYIDAYSTNSESPQKAFDITENDNDPELESSMFNAHRIDVIISCIESNLTTTIANVNKVVSSDYDYRMPVLSETDWYKIANNVTVLSFMQGTPIGNYKYYNNYSLVVNTKNREFISRDAIYLQNNAGIGDLNYYQNSANGQNYHNPRCLSLNNNTYNEKELTGYINTDYEIQSIIDSNSNPEKVVNYYLQPHTAGYECVVKQNDVVFTIDEIMKGSSKTINNDTYSVNQEVRRAYISTLAREKGASYKNFANLNL